MTRLSEHIKWLWKNQPGFRIAFFYLLLLVSLSVVLPILPLPYSPDELDLVHSFAKPFAGKHWLGTDALGRDILANVLYGARTAFTISFPVMLLTSGMGLVIGISAGYFGNKGIQVSRASLLITLLGLFVIFYYGLYLPLNLAKLNLHTNYTLICLLALAIWLTLLYKVALPLSKRWRFAAAKVYLPLDYLMLRLTEAFTSIPKLLLILALASFITPSVLMLCVIFIATFWTSTARLARAETLKIKQLPYFEAAHSLGIPPWQLLARHVLPNMLGPVVVTFTFGLASILALESTLSFLGIGVPGTFVSWGSAIAGIRANTSAWWLVIFPGAALSITVWALQTISFHMLNYFEDKK